MRRAAIIVLACLCWPSAGGGYMRFRTEQRTINPTPAVIGDGSGRLCITVKNGGASGTASIFCGNCDQPATEFWELTPGEQYTWGANYKETFSAQTVTCCYSATGTQLLYVSEEGNMPSFTPTPTPTP